MHNWYSEITPKDWGTYKFISSPSNTDERNAFTLLWTIS
jgi:hypothetical protein